MHDGDPYGPCIFDVAVEHRKEGICPCDVATVAGTEQTIYTVSSIGFLTCHIPGRIPHHTQNSGLRETSGLRRYFGDVTTYVLCILLSIKHS
jgi:hypothetical protein